MPPGATERPGPGALDTAAGGQLYLIQGQNVIMGHGQAVHFDRAEVYHTARIKTYPTGDVEIMTASAPVFRAPGWEDSGAWEIGPPCHKVSDKSDSKSGENVERSMRRAASQLRDIALSTPFRWFVTLTISPGRLDRYDDSAVLRAFRVWANNAVQRCGIAYAVVPERHKDGAIHFHGFVTDGLPLVDSGTISVPGLKRPIRPKNDEKRGEMLQNGGKIVYNVPGWSWGFSTALPISGDYGAAVSYVCKYVRKEGERIGGRWVYKGGRLGRPVIDYADIDIREHEAADGESYAFSAGGVCFRVTRTRTAMREPFK